MITIEELLEKAKSNKLDQDTVIVIDSVEYKVLGFTFSKEEFTVNVRVRNMLTSSEKDIVLPYTYVKTDILRPVFQTSDDESMIRNEVEVSKPKKIRKSYPGRGTFVQE
jgi:hypothetical protein